MQQAIQFDAGRHRIDAPDAELDYWPAWLSTISANKLFDRLAAPGSIAWEQTRIQIYGRDVAIPRLNAVYGDTETRYAYSGATLETHAWTPLLDELRADIERVTGWTFTHVMLNFYRNGHDSMGWHSDDEPELGTNPRIASLSVGCERDFHLRHRTREDIEPIRLKLANGSLLLMHGGCQHHWLHALPKRTGRNLPGPRINLTFRKLIAPGENQ